MMYVSRIIRDLLKNNNYKFLNYGNHNRVVSEIYILHRIYNNAYIIKKEKRIFDSVFLSIHNIRSLHE